MSGIVGILNLNGATVEREMLERLTGLMSYRGPDASGVWADAAVGLGHTMLRTTAESDREQQPCSIDGEVWISADARIDGRAELLAELRSTETRARAKPDQASLDAASMDDARLILYAYHAWGESCLSRLIGDFAFIIWDGRRRQLFCACDHLGVKPFYYAALAECIVMSNTLNCVKAHPSVSTELNDLAVADFLLFDRNQESDTTTFKEIRRLPPAHSLTWSARGIEVSRYWKPPLDGRVRYRKTQDYIEHFKDLLRQATNDRMRADRVSIFMSGGLDSTTVAAAAAQLASGAGTESSLKAFATVFDKQMPDRERHYSGLAAEALGIPIEHLPADGLKLYQDLDGPEAMPPEPFHDPLLAVSIKRLRRASLHSRVALTGQGGDVVFRYSPPSILSWAFGGLLLNSWRYAARYRRVPRLGLRTGLKKLWRGERPQDMDGYPGWLNQDLERRLNLRDRWEFVCGDRPRLHPFRPDSYSLLGLSSWRIIFETYDPGWTRFPLEFRHPLFDTRLVTYLLSLPNEIFFDKIITREAMKGRLPEPVRVRPKTPLVADPMRGQADSFEEIMREFTADPRLEVYVNLSAIPRRAEPADNSNSLWLNLRPISFNLWLRRSGCKA